jgi:integrase
VCLVLLVTDTRVKSFQAEEPSAYRDAFLLGLLTGARRMNVLSTRSQDVTLERREWRTPKGKAGGAHTISLTVEALEILKNRDAAQTPIEAAKRDTDSEREARAREFVFSGHGRTGRSPSSPQPSAYSTFVKPGSVLAIDVSASRL